MTCAVDVSVPADRVIRISWARPEAANAFNTDLVENVIEAIENAFAEASLLILTGKGKHFSAGFDLSSDSEDGELSWRFGRAEHLLGLIRSSPAATVALVHGAAFGIGADIVAACDFRIGDSTSKFKFPGPRFGVVLGTHQLAARVGQQRATEILVTNDLVDAPTAINNGLLSEMINDPSDQEERIAELTKNIGELDKTTLQDLLNALRPSVNQMSSAALSASVHRRGLSESIQQFRKSTLHKP